MGKGNNSSLVRRIPAAALVLISLLYLVTFAIINFGCFAYYCEPDMYADTLIAKLMWEEKTLFPFGYMFGNQLYVVASPVLSAFFYGICGSPNTAMALATSLMSLFIILSLFYMLRPFAKARLPLLAALVMLLSCVFGDQLVRQETGQLFFLFCSYYACYLAILFYCLGDVARSVKDPRLRPGWLALGLLLSFAAGMQSLRQTCIMVLPLLFTELVCVLRRLCRGEKLKAVLRSASLLRSLAYAAANILGLVFVQALPTHQYKIFQAPAQSLGEKLSDVLDALLQISGVNMLSGGSPVYLLLFIFQAIVLLLAAYRCIRYRRWDDPLWRIWWTLLVSIGAVISASLFTSLRIRGIYLFTYYPLLAVSAALLLGDLPSQAGRWGSLLLSILAVLNLWCSYLPSVREAFSAPQDPCRQISSMAVEQGYELVYGGHAFVAPKIAAWSDGQLTSGAWNDEVMFKAQEYLNLQNIYSEEDVHRAIFVFQPSELDYAFEAAANAGAELELLGRYGDLSVYSSTVQLMYPRTYPWFAQSWEDQLEK